MSFLEKLPLKVVKTQSDNQPLVSRTFERELKELGKVVILGCNEGSWPKHIIDCGYTIEWVHSYLWRDGHERPALIYHHERVQVKTEEIGSVACYKCDTFVLNLDPLDNVELELQNLNIAMNWLALNPKIFIVRVMNYLDPQVLALLEKMKTPDRYHEWISMNVKDSGLPEAYFVSYLINPESMKGQAELSPLCESIELPQKCIPKPKATWPVPPNLPDDVRQLAPLDMGETLKNYGQLKMPHKSVTSPRKFMKELGWIPEPSYRVNIKKAHRSQTFDAFVKPLKPLIKDFDQWTVTSNDPMSIERAIETKIDRTPVEEHPYIPYLWATYRAIAEYLRSQGCRIHRLTDAELLASANRSSSMGIQDREFHCHNMGEYLKSVNWVSEVAKFKEALLSGRPVKGAYESFGVREVKNKNKLRVVRSLCATGRLYEAQVLASFDKSLDKLPYTIKRTRLHHLGELFHHMLGHPTRKFAICDDISGWDTRVSYSMLCMESAFLQMLTDDAEHKKEIEHLYRLYAFSVVSYILPDKSYPPEAKKYVRVFYQLQGQVASGRRVTYSMNTVSNIVIQMVRVAMSQKNPVRIDRMSEWVSQLLENSDKFCGTMCGDDSVIVLNKQEANESAKGNGVKVLNEMGFLRKKPNNERADGPSKIINHIEGINFCNRNFVEVPFYVDGQIELTRLIPIKRINEILMRKLLRVKATSEAFDLACSRKHAKSLLVEFFHIPTIRTLALAILSATPNNIALTGDDDNGDKFHFTETPSITMESVLTEINERCFDRGTYWKYRVVYRAQSFDDLGYISDAARKLYDLDHKSKTFQEWLDKLPEIVGEIREAQDSKYNYDDWIEIPKTSQVFQVFMVFILIIMFMEGLKQNSS